MLYNYSQIIDILGSDVVEYQDDKFVHLLSKEVPGFALVVEEMLDKLIIWNCDFQNVDYYELFRTFIESIPVPIWVVFIDNKEQYEAVSRLGGTPLLSNEISAEGYPGKFGSFILGKK